VRYDVSIKPDGSRFYSVWVGSNYIVLEASDDGMIVVTEFEVEIVTIKTALDVDTVAKNLYAYIATNRATFRDLSEDEWQDVGHTGATSTRKPKLIVTQKAMF
jgi:hypothetical protein